MVSKEAVSMEPELGLLVDAVALGLALSRAVGDEIVGSGGTDVSVGEMLACWIVGWLVGSSVGAVDVLGPVRSIAVSGLAGFWIRPGLVGGLMKLERHGVNWSVGKIW